MPNIMVLQYLKKTGGASPAVLMKAEDFVRQGYQRLLTFEVSGGGFSLYGRAPANVMLTAYGLFEFAEMANVIPIDQRILERTRQWLLSKRQSDGTFHETEMPYSLRAGDHDYSLTAFVTWAMVSAGSDEAQVAPSLRYLLDALEGQDDPYALALVLNTLAKLPSRLSDARRLARRLVGIRGPNGWAPKQRTLVFSSGDAGSVETTSLVVLGLAALKEDPASIRAGVAEILRHKEASGIWYTTTATVFALKALVADQDWQPSAEAFTGKVRVSVDGRLAGEIAVSDKTYEVVHQLDLKEFTRPLSVRQSFDRNALAVDDRLKARVELDYSGPPSGSLVLLDLGIPPGFAVQTQELDDLVRQGTVSRYELAGSQLILYRPPVVPGQPVAFEYHLKARFPVRAVTPPSKAYEYYNPANRVELSPVELEVR
ncbi:MAG: hypothetical protein HY815_22120 [Candidatus Riflebacteria bacterium]|nr:hypothetical protein [Candidatus Riflebacteria bacterium]